MNEFDVQADFGKGLLRVNTATVCLFHKRAPRGYAVELAKDVEIPPHHEAVAYVQAVSLASRWERRQQFTGVISALPSFAGDTGLVLGRTLVKSGPGPMPVLLVNPNEAGRALWVTSALSIRLWRELTLLVCTALTHL